MYRDYESRRAFASEIIEASFFGAFVVAIDARKNEDHLTQVELGKRTGREKTGISKLLAGPRNWKLSTISDLAEALDLRLEFVLIDRRNPVRRFTQTGAAFVVPKNTIIEDSNGPVATSINMIDSRTPSQNDPMLLLDRSQNVKFNCLLLDNVFRDNQQPKNPIAV